MPCFALTLQSDADLSDVFWLEPSPLPSHQVSRFPLWVNAGLTLTVQVLKHEQSY